MNNNYFYEDASGNQYSNLIKPTTPPTARQRIASQYNLTGGGAVTNPVTAAYYVDDVYKLKRDISTQKKLFPYPHNLYNSDIPFKTNIITIKDGTDKDWKRAIDPNGYKSTYFNDRPVFRCYFDYNDTVSISSDNEKVFDIPYIKYDGTVDVEKYSLPVFSGLYVSSYYDLKHVNMFFGNEDVFEKIKLGSDGWYSDNNDYKDCVVLEWHAEPEDLQKFINYPEPKTSDRSSTQHGGAVDSVMCCASLTSMVRVINNTRSKPKNQIRQVGSFSAVNNEEYVNGTTTPLVPIVTNDLLHIIDYEPNSIVNYGLSGLCAPNVVPKSPYIASVCSATKFVKGLKLNVNELKEKYGDKAKIRVSYFATYNNLNPYNDCSYNLVLDKNEDGDDLPKGKITEKFLDDYFFKYNNHCLNFNEDRYKDTGLVGYWGFSNYSDGLNTIYDSSAKQYVPALYSTLKNPVPAPNYVQFKESIMKNDILEKPKFNQYEYESTNINKFGNYEYEFIEKIDGEKEYPFRLNIYRPNSPLIKNITKEDLQQGKYLKIASINFFEQYDDKNKTLHENVFQNVPNGLSARYDSSTNTLTYYTEPGTPLTGYSIDYETKYHNLWKSIKPNTYLSSYLDDTTSGQELKKFLSESAVFYRNNCQSVTSDYHVDTLDTVKNPYNVYANALTSTEFIYSKKTTSVKNFTTFDLSLSSFYYDGEWKRSSDAIKCEDSDFPLSLHGCEYNTNYLTHDYNPRVDNLTFKTHYDIDLTTATDEYLWITYPGVNNLNSYMFYPTPNYIYTNTASLPEDLSFEGYVGIWNPIYTKFQMKVQAISGR